MLQTFCEFSSDYPSLLRSLSDPVTLNRSGKIIQFPFAQSAVDEKTEEEQARLTERRKEQGKRLQEIAAKARLEKVSTSYLTMDHVRYNYFSWKPKRRTCARCWSLETGRLKPMSRNTLWGLPLTPGFWLFTSI